MYNAKYVIIDGSAIIFSAAIQHKEEDSDILTRQITNPY